MPHFLSVFICVHNPNTVFLKSLLACVSRSLLVHLKCEHLTFRPAVDSFLERGVCLADMESVTGQCNFPLGGYRVPSRACWWCQKMHKSNFDLVVHGQIWLLRQYSLQRDTAELFITVHWLAVLPKMPIIKCAGGKGPLFSLWNESEYLAYYHAENKCLQCFVSQNISIIVVTLLIVGA